jgi:hypothetical protein
MDRETYNKAKRIDARIRLVTDILDSIRNDGLKLEYDTKTTHGHVPQRLIVDNSVKDMIIEYYERELSELQKEMEAL